MTEDLLARAVSALDRIGKVLGALYASQVPKLNLGQKANLLRRCGFTNVEIADILGSTANAIGVALHGHRKGGRRKIGKRRAKP